MKRLYKIVVGCMLMLAIVVNSAAADWLSQLIFNNAIGRSQGVSGFNPFQLGSLDFLLSVAQNGNVALLTSSGFSAGAIGLIGQFNAQAQQGGGAYGVAPPPLPFFGVPLYFGDANSVRQFQRNSLGLFGLNPFDPLNASTGQFRCNFYPGQPC